MAEPEDSLSETKAAYPRVFGKYLLLASLGRGGMGEVHLAKHTGLAGIERHCVIKTIRSGQEQSGETLSRFIDEARTSVNLNHRNICGTTDVGEVEDTVFLAMDYIGGKNLATVRKSLAAHGRALSAPLALFITHELLEALDYAHRKKHAVSGEPLGIVHRDVSPQNVMVSFEGEVKLIDFGLASSKLKTEHTGVGNVMGKLAYMAPEHARGDRVSGAADQFAVAVMLYELLTGSRYYDGLERQQVWERAGTGEHVPKHWRDLDPEIVPALARALHPEPAHRFKTCADFRRALEDYQRRHAGFAGADGLRALLADLFPDAEVEQRELFASFERLRALPERHDDPNEAATQPVPIARVIDMPVSAEGAPLLGDDDLDERSSLSPAEMTEDLTAASSPSGAPAQPAVTEMTMSELSAGTERRQRRGGALLGAAAGLVLLVGITVGILMQPGPDEEPIVDPPQADPSPSPPDPPPEPPTAATADPAPVPPPAAAPPAPPPPPAATPAPPATGETKPRNRRSRGARRARKKPAAATTPEPAPPPTPRAPLTTTGAKVRFLKEQCRGRVPCAKRVISRFENMDAVPVDEVRLLPQQLDQCVARCQR